MPCSCASVHIMAESTAPPRCVCSSAMPSRAIASMFLRSGVPIAPDATGWAPPPRPPDSSSRRLSSRKNSSATTFSDAVTGRASSAPITPSSVDPISTATMITNGDSEIVFFCTSGWTMLFSIC